MKYEIENGSAQFIAGFEKAEQFKAWFSKNMNIVGFAMVGRSNVGKSSLINSLIGKNAARVSNTPGRTREINIFTFNLLAQGKKAKGIPPLYFFDLPGYGFAEISKEKMGVWQELMAQFFEIIPPSIAILNIQDARHPAQESDLLFKEYLSRGELQTFLLLNKMDKLKTQKERAQLEKVKPLLKKEFNNIREIFCVSAEKNTGIDQVEMKLISFILTQAGKA